MEHLAFHRAVLVSVLTHAGIVGLVAGGWEDHGSKPAAEVLAPDAWQGETFEVSTEALTPPGPAPASRPPPAPEVEGKTEARVNPNEPAETTPLRLSTEPTPSRRAEPSPVTTVASVASTATAASVVSTATVAAASPPSLTTTLGAVSSQPAALDLGAAMRASAAGPPERGLFGGVGVDLRERNLFRALVRAVPVAVRGEERWWDKHTGYRAEVRFLVTLDDSGKLTDVEWLEPRSSPSSFDLVRRLSGLLRAGQFALIGEREQKNRQAFRLVLEMQHQPSPDSESDEPGNVVEMGFEAPLDAARGTAFLRDASGRRLVGTLWRITTQLAAPVAEEQVTTSTTLTTSTVPALSSPASTAHP